MFKDVKDKVWVFDVEWVPDPVTGKSLYGLAEDTPDEDVIQEMWKKGGATDENPMPYLKTVLCRVVSISVVTRTVSNGETKLHLLSLPRDSKDPAQVAEAHIVETFLSAIGTRKPQVVGYNSHAADLKILIQRGLANGIQVADFCRRPNKPWEGIDYFARGSDWNVDLIEIVGGWGKSNPSLNEMVTVCGIPGKITGDGQQVAPLWLDGELDKIIAYNEFDSLTTYLLWLRLAYFGGFFTSEQYAHEQELLQELLKTESEKPERAHLRDYLAEWERLRAERS
ncbi:3'-5' exonuclease [Desulfonema magnum]|uniref:3'-5' exonuclease n=1 Tax=Desulfonema magnum TaxID=45655 RepID=UPI001A9A7FFA|nr:3'-5' exonuclease [Desulfonema magnum]